MRAALDRKEAVYSTALEAINEVQPVTEVCPVDPAGAPAAGFMILPRTGRATETSRFLLQEHGGVRVIRGVSEEANFEAVTGPPDKEEEEPTAVPPPVPATTRRRGIVTHRIGGPGQVRARLHGQGPKKANPRASDWQRPHVIPARGRELDLFKIILRPACPPAPCPGLLMAARRSRVCRVAERSARVQSTLFKRVTTVQ